MRSLLLYSGGLSVLGDAMHTSLPTSPSRRDLLRRGALLGGAMLWVPPTVQMLDVSAAAAADPSAAPVDPPSHCEVVVEVVKRVTIKHGDKSYKLPREGTRVGLKYDESDGGWVRAVRNPASCIPTDVAFVHDDAVHADFLANVTVTTGTPAANGKAPYVLQLPPRYRLVRGWSKRGRQCGIAGVSGANVVFP
jgi:hypothetical protein